MTITPSKFLIQDPMPSLGALVREAIQPKPDPLISFEIIRHSRVNGVRVYEEDCRQIKGAAQVLRSESVQTEPPATTPVSAPPSPVVAGKFKPGDKVRVKAAYAHYFPINEFTIHSVCDGEAWAIDPNDNCDGMFHFENIELIPPAVTPDDGWIEWKGGECPVSKGAIVRVRCTTPFNPRESGEVDISANGVAWGSKRVLAYRVVKP